jgi:AcrR family transcriptional regulator
MYHISKDKRCLASAELIYKGLISLLGEKDYEEITVSDIQKASSVARSTFYRNFDNISDVLYWKCDVCFKEVLSSFSPQQFSSEFDMIDGYFSYWLAHSDILEYLLKINRIDIIYACHSKNAEEMAKQYGKLPNMDEASSRYFLAIRTGLTISVLTAWLKGGKKETPRQIERIIKESNVLNQNKR